MKKITTFLLFALLIVANGNAQTNVKLDEVIKASSNFILTQNIFKNYNAESIGAPSEMLDRNGNVIAYVVDLKPSGFVVLSALKEQKPIIAYSTEGNFSLKEKNNIVLNIISKNSEFLRKTMTDNISKERKEDYIKNISSWNKLVSNKQSIGKKLGLVYGPLLTDVWGGVNCVDDTGANVYPTNYFTPNHYSAGCVAISMAQVLHYFEWPTTGVGSHTYNDNQGSSQKTYSVDFGNTTYDYANMLDEYYGVPSTDTEQRAVGRLAYHCAVSVDMDFENTGSTSNVDKQPAALDNYFRFAGHYETPGSYAAFWTRMRENLSNGLPVLLSIKDSDTGAGHAPVVDGYDENTGKYHINWGWYNVGTANGWYDIEAWSPGGAGYDTVNGAVLDVLPDPEITNVERTSVEREFTVKWAVSAKLPAGSTFSIEQSKDGGAFTVLASDIAINEYAITVADAGDYRYRVRAKVTGSYYYNSYSEEVGVAVKDDITALDFDGNDSYFVNDNSNNDLDIKYTYTIETWFNVRNRASGTYPLLMDRRIVFSLFLIDDATVGADYALRFVARSSSGSDAIIASVRTDASSAVLKYNTWHHVAITRDYNNSINTTRIFIDGNLIDSSTDPDFQLHYTANALNIGARYWDSGYERYLDGKLDGISISKVAKYTSDFVPDILVNYPVDANTVLAMNLDEGTGSTIHDEAGNFSSISLRASTNDPNWYFETYVAGDYTWRGTTDSNWNDSGNWETTATMKLPRTGDNIIIDNTSNLPSIPEGSYTYNDINITSSNNLNLTGNSTFKVKGNLTNAGTIDLSVDSKITVENSFDNSGTITINSDATSTGSMIVKGSASNTGTINVERYLNDPGEWQLVSTPLNGQHVSVFKGHFLNSYDSNAGSFESITDETTPLNSGEGYVAKLDWYFGSGVDAPNPVVFNTGQISVSDLSMSLDVTEDMFATTGTHVSNSYFDLPAGFHLLGNPFTSNIDWNTIYNYGVNSSNITSYLYFYTDGVSTTNDDNTPPVKSGWQVYKAGTITSADSLISIGQAFGVMMVDNTSAKQFTIPADARTHETNANVFHKRQEVRRNSFKINVVSNNVIDEAVVNFNEEATSDFDYKFDAYKLKPFDGSPCVSIISTDNSKLAVSEMPTCEEVNLGFEMNTSGDVTLSLSGASDFSNILLEDKLENKFIDILDSSYSFYYTDSKKDKNRFVLHFNKEALGNNEELVDVSLYSSNDVVYFKSANTLSDATISIFNTSGSNVFNRELGQTNSETIKTNLSSGIYVVKVSSSEGTAIKKIVIR